MVGRLWQLVVVALFISYGAQAGKRGLMKSYPKPDLLNVGDRWDMSVRRFSEIFIRFLASFLLLVSLSACQGYASIPDLEGDSSEEEVEYVPVGDGYRVVQPESASGSGG